MAKKTKKFNVNERLKKQPVDSDWLRNAGKSLGITAFDVVKEMFPSTYEFVDFNQDTVRDLIVDLRKNVGSKRMLVNQIKNLPHMQIASDALKNARDDLKSGNFNNQDRFGDNFDFGFDDSDIFGDDDFQIFDDEPSIDGDANQGPTPSTVIDTMPLARAINSGTQATVSTMISIADQQMVMESEKLAFSQTHTNAMVGGLSAINDNLSLLVSFNADSTSKFHAASMKYFEESIEYLKNLDEKNKKEEGNKKRNSLVDSIFTAAGGVRLGDLGERIKKNIEDLKDENVFLSGVYDIFTDTDALKMMASNPLGEIAKMFATKLIPSVTKKLFGELDNSLNQILPAVLARIDTFEDSDNPLLNYIYKVLNTKEKLKYDIYLDEYEKGAISWDGESKKALVEVIPSYLRKIESVLTGQAERIYDYDRGTFATKEMVEKNIENSIRKAELSGYSESKSLFRDKLREKNLSDADYNQAVEDFEAYLRLQTQLGKFISPKIRQKKDGSIQDDFTDYKLFGGDQKRIDIVRDILVNEFSGADLAKMAKTELADSANRTYRLIQKMQENTSLSGYASLYNDQTGNVYDKNVLLNKLGNNKIAGDPIAKVVRDQPDNFGLKPVDYLRDIRHALIEGIRVFPDIQKRYYKWEPNMALKAKEQMEIDELIAKTTSVMNTMEMRSSDENKQEIKNLGDIVKENNETIKSMKDQSTKNALGINTKAKMDEDEEDYEKEEREKKEREEGLKKLKAKFGFKDDAETKKKKESKIF